MQGDNAPGGPFEPPAAGAGAAGTPTAPAATVRPSAAAPCAPLVPMARSETLTPLLPCGLTEKELSELACMAAAADSRRGSRVGPEDGGAGLPASASACSPVASPGTPASPGRGAAARSEGHGTRLSFERINRVAAAVAAEKARRRSLEQQRRRERPRSQGQLARQPEPRRRQAAPSHPLLQLGRQRSLSEGQLDAMLGPPTPRGSVEAVTAAQRLAAISPDPSTLSLAAPDTPRAAEPTLQGKRPTAAGYGAPRPVRRSAPPHTDAAWRLQLRQQAGAAAAEGGTPPGSPFGLRGRRRDPDPLLPDLPGGSKAEAVTSWLQRSSSEHSEFGDEPPTAEARPQAGPPRLPLAGVPAAAAEHPAFPSDPGYGGYSAGPAGAAASAAGRPSSFPLDDGRRTAAAPNAMMLRLASEPHGQAGQPQPQQEQEQEAETPRRRKGLLASFNRLLRI